MAMAVSATSSACATRAPTMLGRKGNRGRGSRVSRVRYISGLSSFEGLKAQNYVTSLGVSVSTEKSFAKIVSSLREPVKGKGRVGGGGGALSAVCNAIGEIFKIASIMPALVLVGVAVGFVLLRIEAWLEESESS